MLNLNWALRLAQTISAETCYNMLLRNGVYLVGESIGVEKALFLSLEEGVWLLCARYTKDQGAVLLDSPLPAAVSGEICMVLLDRVIHTGKKEVLGDSLAPQFFKDTPYGKEFKPKSVVCQPILSSGKVGHLLYLENRIDACDYSEERLDMMEMVSAQLAISLKISRQFAARKAKRTEGKSSASGREAGGSLDKETGRQGRVTQEKMAALGALTAGVAHEINNPTNFTHSSAQKLEIELQEFKEFLLDLAADGGEEIRQAFHDEMAPLFRRVATIKEGTRRIIGIVQDLRTFSRVDETVKKMANISENLQSTVNLIKSNYRDRVNFVCHFHDPLNLPCFAAELNQVFMNIIVNASQAIVHKQDESDNKEPGEVTVETAREGEWAIIHISDTGRGMPPQVLDRIFDSFFTTKGARSGTGLGLSLSREMIQRQGGRIEVSSSIEKGSLFTIYLPVNVVPPSP